LAPGGYIGRNKYWLSLYSVVCRLLKGRRPLLLDREKHSNRGRGASPALSHSERSIFTSIVGEWVGLADNDDSIEEMRGFNPNDEAALKQYVLRTIGMSDQSVEQKAMRLRVFNKFAGLSRIEQEDIWDGYLPPFNLPEDTSVLYGLIRERIENSSAAPSS
jgi:hypothetical protein